MNRNVLFIRLWDELTRRNIDPRKLVLTVERDPNVFGWIVDIQLQRFKKFIAVTYRVTDEDYQQMNDPESLVALRTAHGFENHFFPYKIKWEVAFEKRLDEMEIE